MKLEPWELDEVWKRMAEDNPSGVIASMAQQLQEHYKEVEKLTKSLRDLAEYHLNKESDTNV
jgi:hypothetical protein